ncbi:putative monocarboxylate transporter protein [Neurospora hispaniola]|uniref:Monocarboxylate transporter protein n=1 Tax=Neurospora hispaniola TaxID=588809 RepID=A0AAJ0I184_9PEZI|nr:putative monocarboxylate transporter protein [Neurospora hispaniola]
MLLSLCDKYWQVMLVQGVLMGIAMGAVFKEFDKKRTAALRVVVSGSSVGDIVIPLLCITGFLVMPFMLFPCMVVKARLPPRATDFYIPAACKDTGCILLIASLFFIFIGMFTPLFFILTPKHLLAILSAVSTFSHVIPGISADKVIIFCTNSAVSGAALSVYSVASNFGSGTIISGTSAAFSMSTKSQQDIGTIYGNGHGHQRAWRPDRRFCCACDQAGHS